MSEGSGDDCCETKAYDCGRYVIGRMFGPNGRPVGRCPECEDGMVFQHMVSRLESASVGGSGQVGTSGGDPAAETSETTATCADSRYGEGCGETWVGDGEESAVNRYVEDAQEAFDPVGGVDVEDVRWVASPTGVVDSLATRYVHAANLLDVPCPGCGDAGVRLHTRQRGVRLMLGSAVSGSRSQDYGPDGEFAGCGGCGRLWKNETSVREEVAENRRVARALRNARERGSDGEGETEPESMADTLDAERDAARERASREACERECGDGSEDSGDAESGDEGSDDESRDAGGRAR